MRISAIFRFSVFCCSSLCLTSGVETKSVTRGLRGLSDEVDSLLCRVLSWDAQYDKKSTGGFDCVPVTPQGELEIMYSLDLPEDFINEHRLALESGETYIIIPGGEYESRRGQQRGFVQQKADDAVYMPPGTPISILTSPEDHPVGLFRRTKRVIDPYGVRFRKVLVLRVSTSDATPKLSQPELTDNFFADDSLTLRSQYNACSFGKMIFEPAEDDEKTGIIGGVLEIKLDMKAVNTTRRTLTNAATLAAQLALNVVSLEGNYDNVIYCHPPGTLEMWEGFSYMNYFVSAFNDEFCGYVSGNMHEVGHTMGLWHSNEKGFYRDQTGAMGFSYPRKKWPRFCFNGHKNWFLGWYRDRTITVDPVQSAWKGRVAAFADYDLTTEGMHVIINVGDLYLQYNRAKKMNRETREKANQLTITQEVFEGSELLAGLTSYKTGNANVFELPNYTKNGDKLVIAVCQTVAGSSSSPDYMVVSVALNEANCECEDSVHGTFRLDNEDKTCIYLADINRGQLREELCVPSADGKGAYEVCPETCGKCWDDCYDSSDETFIFKKSVRNCAWLAARPREWGSACAAVNGTATEICKETCESC